MTRAKSTALAEPAQADQGPPLNPTPRPTTPSDLVHAAIEKGFNAEQLKELTSWANGVIETEARQAYSRDMIACQAVMPSIVNDAENPSTKSRYPKFETLLRVAKPIWTQHGFSLSFGTLADAPEGHMRVVCDVRHRGGHSERYQMDIGLDGIGPQGNPIGKMNKPQASGSTVAYGQRYLVKLIFCLAFANEDDDAVNARRNVIGEEQLEALRELIAACKEAGDPVDMHSLLDVARAEKLETVLQAEYANVLHLLRRKRKLALAAKAEKEQRDGL